MTVMDRYKLAKQIKIYMIQKGITQRELAKKMHITPQAVSKFLTGQNSMRLSTLQKFVQALEADEQIFLEGQSDITRNPSTTKKTSEERISLLEKEILDIKADLITQKHQLHNLTLEMEKRTKTGKAGRLTEK